MGAEIPEIARKWMRKTEIGKGIQLDADQLDLLNALGVGKMIADAAAEYQRDQCLKRSATSRSTKGGNGVGNSGSSHDQDETTKSSGTTPPPDAKEQLARARRKSRPPRRRSTPSTSKSPKESNPARPAGDHLHQLGAGS